MSVFEDEALDLRPFDEILMSPIITFLVGDYSTRFRVHGAAFARLSASLNSLINDSMVYQQGPERRMIVLEEVDYNTFVRFCRFAYTGDFEGPWARAYYGVFGETTQASAYGFSSFDEFNSVNDFSSVVEFSSPPDEPSCTPLAGIGRLYSFAVEWDVITLQELTLSSIRNSVPHHGAEEWMRDMVELIHYAESDGDVELKDSVAICMSNQGQEVLHSDAFLELLKEGGRGFWYFEDEE